MVYDVKSCLVSFGKFNGSTSIANIEKEAMILYPAISSQSSHIVEFEIFRANDDVGKFEYHQQLGHCAPRIQLVEFSGVVSAHLQLVKRIA